MPLTKVRGCSHIPKAGRVCPGGWVPEGLGGVALREGSAQGRPRWLVSLVELETWLCSPQE